MGIDQNNEMSEEELAACKEAVKDFLKKEGAQVRTEELADPLTDDLPGMKGVELGAIERTQFEPKRREASAGTQCPPIESVISKRDGWEAYASTREKGLTVLTILQTSESKVTVRVVGDRIELCTDIDVDNPIPLTPAEAEWIAKELNKAIDKVVGL